MKSVTLFLVIILIFIGCSRKHLDEKAFRSGDITVKWYRISEITTVHDFVDMERWGHHKNIMEANTSGVFDVLIDHDTVTIKANKGLVIYDLVAKTLNCYIKLDTTTMYSDSNKGPQ